MAPTIPMIWHIPRNGPNLSGTLIKDDSSGNNSGNVTLGAVQTYTGATYVEAGTLTLGVANAIADSSGVTLGRVGFASTAVLALSANKHDHNPLQRRRKHDIGHAERQDSDRRSARRRVRPRSAERFSDGSSSGGSLVIDGPGTEILTGNDTFAGGVALENGTLDIGAHDAAGTGTDHVRIGDRPDTSDLSRGYAGEWRRVREYARQFRQQRRTRYRRPQLQLRGDRDLFGPRPASWL